jgi:hypothetical protein
MYSLFLQYTIAGACLLFVVSLPIAKLPIARTLRQLAAALVLLAVLPSVFFGVIASPAAPSGAAGHAGSGAHPFALIGGLVALSCLAYGILAIRRTLKKSPKDAWSEYVAMRSSGKRPAGTDPRAGHRASLFDEEEP